MLQRCIRRLVLGAVLTLSMTGAAQAIVESIDAAVTAEVQEFQGNVLSNSDLAFEDLDDTTGLLPLLAAVELPRLGQEAEVGAAFALTQFSDPRISVLPDPNEFGLNVAAFSVGEALAYTGRSLATESREITFLAEEIGVPDGSELEAQSQFFVDGLIVIWSESSDANLAGTTADVSLRVNQTLTTDGGDTITTVMTAGLLLMGTSDAAEPFTLATTGALEAANVVLVDLTGLVPELGQIHAIVIPASAIPYVYPAVVGEPFMLEAAIEARVNAGPGTGASVQLGLPIDSLAGIVNEVAGGQAGDVLQQVLEGASTSSPLAAKPLPRSDVGTTVKVVRVAESRVLPFGLCGVLGIESALAAACFALLASIDVRRR